MNRRWKIILRLLLATASGFTLRGAEPAPAIAVLDFTVPAAAGSRWEWAKSGAADLLQIELERAGISTLDRDFIHAVLGEQRLAVHGSTTKDYLALSSLLNARHLIAGNVTPLEGGRFRVEASAFSVESIETVVVGMSEGVFPKELSLVVESVARTLAKKLQTADATATNSVPPSYAPKPESLIMFYRGINACARGRPELGVAWFMNSSSLDPEFAAPLLWEIKAWEMAGLEKHAAIRREEVAPILKKLEFGFTPGTNAGSRDSKPVLAVLNPVLVGRDFPSSAALGAVLRQSLVASGQVRLFAFENIGEAVAEQDLRLSALFTRQNAPRYGRWLMSDALLMCRVSERNDGQVVVNAAVVNPLTSATLKQFERSGSRRELDSLVAATGRKLIEDWLGEKASATLTNSLPLSIASRSEETQEEMRPVFQGLAAAMEQVRRESANSDFHRTLANALGATGRYRQTALEIEQCLDTLNIDVPGGDLIYLGTYHWLFHEGGASPLGAGVSLVDTNKLARLVESFLQKFPRSIAAGCMWYNLARDQWSTANWELCHEHAARARQVLEPFPVPEKGPVQLHHEVVGAAYYLEGYSLLKLGRLEQARAVFRQAQDFCDAHKLRNYVLPIGPGVGEIFGSVRIVGFGGDGPNVRAEISKELALLEPRTLGASPSPQREAAEIAATAGAQPVGQQEWLQRAQKIIDILANAPVVDDGALQEIFSSAKSCLGAARGKSADDAALRPLVHQLVAVLLAKQKIPSLENGSSTPLTKFADAAIEIISIYDSAGMKEEGWSRLEPLFSKRYPVELTLDLLLRLEFDKERYRLQFDRALTRLRAEEKDVPAIAWIKLGQIHFQNHSYRDALESYRKALAKNASPAQCPGLTIALAEVALEKNLAGSRDAVLRCSRELGFPLIEPTCIEWFNLGRKYHVGRPSDFNKAVNCFRNAINFLENPEKTGAYRLEKDGPRIRLSWADGFDLMWSMNYDSRWYSSAFYLAQCLIEIEQEEEAAKWLRRIALKAGGDKFDLLEEVSWTGTRYQTVLLGVRAAEMLKQLHLEQGDDKQP